MLLLQNGKKLNQRWVRQGHAILNKFNPQGDVIICHKPVLRILHLDIHASLQILGHLLII